MRDAGSCHVICLNPSFLPSRFYPLNCMLGAHYCLSHNEEFLAPDSCPGGRGAQRKADDAEMRAGRLREMCDQ